MIAKVRATRSRKLITYADHWHTANTLDKLAREDPKGSFHKYLASILFRAFALEAFLNHLGEEQFKCWADLERLSPKAKLNIIAENAGVEPKYGSMPWQIVPKLIAIRNKVAHGKNELLEDERILSADDYDREMGEMLKAEWQEFASEANGTLIERQLTDLMLQLWTACGHSVESLFVSGMQVGSANMIQEKDAQ